MSLPFFAFLSIFDKTMTFSNSACFGVLLRDKVFYFFRPYSNHLFLSPPPISSHSHPLYFIFPFPPFLFIYFFLFLLRKL